MSDALERVENEVAVITDMTNGDRFAADLITLCAEVRALRAERVRLLEERAHTPAAVWEESCHAAEEEAYALRAALEHYAESGSWEPLSLDYDRCTRYAGGGHDGYSRAREVLGWE